MNFSVTGNDIVEQRWHLRNSRSLSSGSELLYLRFKPTIWAQRYPRKYTNCTIPFQERHFPYHYVMQKNSSCIETVQRYLCKVLHFNRQKL